jgi:hypothetical protein
VIVYADTSALVKVYVLEAGSSDGRRHVHLASALVLRKHADEEVKLFYFNGRLSVAARKEGLKVA